LATPALVLTPLRAAGASISVTVEYSPAVAILDSGASDNWMTVHANLRFRNVDTTQPVEPNGLSAIVVGSDNRGDCVAKFDLAALKSLLTPPALELTLTGFATDGSHFSSPDVVRVVK